MFLKMEKSLWSFVGIFEGELRRKDIVKPRPKFFTNVFLAAQWDRCLQGYTDQTYGMVTTILIKKEAEGGGRQGMDLQADWFPFKSRCNFFFG